MSERSWSGQWVFFSLVLVYVNGGGGDYSYGDDDIYDNGNAVHLFTTVSVVLILKMSLLFLLLFVMALTMVILSLLLLLLLLLLLPLLLPLLLLVLYGVYSEHINILQEHFNVIRKQGNDFLTLACICVVEY